MLRKQSIFIKTDSYKIAAIEHQGNRRSLMRNRYIWMGIFFILLQLSSPFLCALEISARVSIQELRSNPEKYDEKEVTLQGKIYQIQKRISKGGTHTIFTLTDGSGGALNIVIFSSMNLMEGQDVTVIGSYHKAWKIGNHTLLRDEFSAKVIEEHTK